jgi:predicted nuclease with TOPRIM domain
MGTQGAVEVEYNRALSGLAVSDVRQEMTLNRLEVEVGQMKDCLYLIQASIQECRVRLAHLEEKTEGTTGSLSRLEDDLDKLEEEVEGQTSLVLHAKKEVVSSTIGWIAPIALAFLAAMGAGILGIKLNPHPHLLPTTIEIPSHSD